MNRIKELRSKKKISTQELANATGIARSTLGSYETRGINPNAEKAQILADYFNVSVGYLLGNTDMPKDIIENYNYKQEINSFIKDLDESNYKNWDLIEKSIYLQCIQAISLLSVEERKFINEYLWALLEKRSSESN
ncbi:helix-turn-helix domain-containing protein [Lactococcus lactis]|uniref:helix-turn-helix domain-containing protein n=1 Tax=Lactococcus lactis TaxID=1358 RepID=UPI00071CAFD8|nr:helix-turn-helix transcriptional regulator [Lactococcus lactis]MDT2887583.1 helix-turn-helix transcriptional regulator [Lactococcus lactis]MDT2930214.1 helix-turn-helix transcriptional regulator [Lactococcus lactis]